MTGSRKSADALGEAETIALRVLGFIASTEDLFDVFVNASGVSADHVPTLTEAPEFLAAVLDFLLMDDRWVIDFAKAEGIAPEVVMQARAGLPGGDLPNWT